MRLQDSEPDRRSDRSDFTGRGYRPLLACDRYCLSSAVALLAQKIHMGEDGAKMYEWFDRVGFTVDRAALRREFPDVAFHDFESWAKAQDGNTLLQGA